MISWFCSWLHSYNSLYPFAFSLLFFLSLSSLHLSLSFLLSSQGPVQSSGQIQSGPFYMHLTVLFCISTMKIFSSTMLRNNYVLSFTYLVAKPLSSIYKLPSKGLSFSEPRSLFDFLKVCLDHLFLLASTNHTFDF